MSTNDDAGSSCCFKFCRFIITAGLAALFLWLALRTSKPTCSIESFYVPILNKSDHSAAARNNNSIFFDLKLHNRMKEKGVYYDNISLTFFSVPNPNTSFPIANYTVAGFRQGHGKNAHRKAVVEARGRPWEAAVRIVSNSTGSIFRVRLSTKVRFRIIWWRTKRHNLVVGADIPLNDSGEKVGKKGVKLKSSSPERDSRRPFGLSLFFIVLLALL